MRLRLPVLGLMALVLFGCSSGGFDEAQARVCRLSLPALYEQDARIDVIREATGPSPRTIAIDYRIVDGDNPRRVARTICTFAGSGYSSGRFELEAISTDGRAISDVKLYVLKRWWLEPLGVAVSDEPSGRTTTNHDHSLQLSSGAAYLLQQIINGLPVGAVYALVAVAYSLVYGLTGRIALAFGDIAIYGAYGAAAGAGVILAVMAHSPAPALMTGLATGLFWACVLGFVAARLVISPLAPRPGQAMLVAMLGLSVVIQEFLRITQGAGDKWLPPVKAEAFVVAETSAGFFVTVSPQQFAIALISFSLCLITVLTMRHTGFGRSWRAVSDDGEASALLGVDPVRILVWSVVLGSALAAVAGWILLVNYGGIGFSQGLSIGLKAIIAAVIGGIGSIGGALLGGLFLGMAETLWSGYFPSAWRDVAVFGALIIVLGLRPGGFFGFAELGPRRI